MTIRHFGNYPFSHVGQIQPESDEVGKPRSLMPQARYAASASIPLNAYGHGPFCHFHISGKLNHEGVYVLTLDGVPCYVGECLDLSQRYNNGYGNISPRNCYVGGQLTNCRINNLIYMAAKDKRKIDLWFFKTLQRKAIEAELIQALGTRQHWNRKD
jgi:hypothetical protein